MTLCSNLSLVPNSLPPQSLKPGGPPAFRMNSRLRSHSGCLIAGYQNRGSSHRASARPQRRGQLLPEGWLLPAHGQSLAGADGVAQASMQFSDKDEHVYFWFPLLAGLSELTFDPRPDIRYSALEVRALAVYGPIADLSRNPHNQPMLSVYFPWQTASMACCSTPYRVANPCPALDEWCIHGVLLANAASYKSIYSFNIKSNFDNVAGVV